MHSIRRSFGLAVEAAAQYVVCTANKLSSTLSVGLQVIHMMRHGQTEMNLFLAVNPQSRMGQLDPKL